MTWLGPAGGLPGSPQRRELPLQALGEGVRCQHRGELRQEEGMGFVSPETNFWRGAEGGRLWGSMAVGKVRCRRGACIQYKVSGGDVLGPAALPQLRHAYLYLQRRNTAGMEVRTREPQHP